MDYQTVEQTIKAGYREVSERYRRDDEIEVTSRNHQRIRGVLQRLCASFPRPISALEAGCGTGRYFHCLTNVDELTGLDISNEMLNGAGSPVRGEQICVKKLRLVCGNIYLAAFPSESFDLIYSLGMFGNGCPVTAELCDRFHNWLKPGGKLYFNVVDFDGMPFWYRTRRRARALVYPVLPRRLQTALDERQARHPMFGMTRRGLEEILKATRFEAFQVKSHRCESPLWNGCHLECIAGKASGVRPSSESRNSSNARPSSRACSRFQVAAPEDGRTPGADASTSAGSRLG